MKKAALFILFPSILCTIQCTDSPTNNTPDTYLVFGHFHGECFGEACVEIFKIENGNVYEDSLDIYPVISKMPHETDYVQLLKEKYELVRDLQNHIPDELMLEDSMVIGQPDAGDWGGLYLETNKTGDLKYWLIDKKKSNIPDYLHAFTDSLNAAIQRLQ